MTTCLVLLVVAFCEPPRPPPQIDAARFCQTIRGLGGPVLPSRWDTERSAAQLAAIARAYRRVCR